MRTIERNSTVRFVRPVATGGVLIAILLAVRSALGWLDDRLEKHRSRGALEALTDSQLKDIGISRADAYREARRSFWD